MPKIKAKFNAEYILESQVIYPKEFIEMVNKHKDQIIEVEEEVFSGYELELEGSIWALDDKEIVLEKDVND